MSLARAAFLAAPLVSVVSLAAQNPPIVKTPRALPMQADVKSPRPDDASKGVGEVSPFGAAERAAEARRKPHAAGPLAQSLAQGLPSVCLGDAVLYGTGGDGRLWASGATYKASFGAEGFTYVPFLGPKAPRNHPVHFALASVRVGGRTVAFTPDSAPIRNGDRVEFDRGVVREVYDLTPHGVEQTFVVDGALPGDVEVELKVTTDLVEDASVPGLQFAGERGCVRYGAAYLVANDRKQAIGTTFRDGSIRLHVPAAQRSVGAVVIDPVISTGYTATTSAYEFDRPDVSFDASTNRYLLVWEREFSATDMDVLAEMRDATGAYVPNSAVAIEIGSDYWSRPRVANLNAYNRFLVVAEKFVAANPAGQQYTIWGRTVDAQSVALGAPFEVSGSQSGDKRDPDVGGDPNLATPTYWTVVYTRELSSTDHDIHGRQVDAAGAPRPNTLLLENSSATIFRNAEISHGNGDIGASAQRWAVVFNYRFSATDNDVYGLTLSWDGIVEQTTTAIDTSSRSHSWPSVSSLAHAFPGGPAFGVTYEDDTNQQDLVATVVDSALASIVPPANLSAMLGHTQFIASRIETDGCRFAVSYAAGLPAYAATLGVIGSSFVRQEAPQMLGSGHDAWDLNLVSRAAAGGSNTGYGIVFRDANATPDKIVFATYEGHGQGGFATRATGCNGLGITAVGRPLLGRTFTVGLTGAGADLVGLMVGVPMPALTICTGCRLGLALDGPVLNVPNATTLNLNVPCLHTLVRGTLSVQGYAVGSGTCLGLMRLGDTLDATIQ